MTNNNKNNNNHNDNNSDDDDRLVLKKKKMTKFRLLYLLLLGIYAVSIFVSETKQIWNSKYNTRRNTGHMNSNSKEVGAEEEDFHINLINISVNDELLQSRLSELSFYYHKYSFVHISKCAGASWIKELVDLLPYVQPTKMLSLEYSVAYQKTKYYTNTDVVNAQPKSNVVHLMTSFKHPRAHIWSLWGECIFDKFWNTHESIPYNTTSSYETNFESWLNHFLFSSQKVDTTAFHPQKINNENDSNTYKFQIHDYNCYHPANYQSRHLTAPSNVSKPHGVSLLPNDQYQFEPNIDKVRSVRNTELDWISISEFFHESKCLLYHRLYKSLSSLNKTNIQEIYDKTIQQSNTQPKVLFIIEEKMTKALKDIPYYLNRYCRCDAPPPEISAGSSPSASAAKAGRKKIQQVKHFTEGKRSSFIDLPQTLLEKMDWFIRIDTINYRESLIEFLLEIASLEKELDRQVLCDTTIAKWEQELSYIGLPDKLSNVYKWAKSYTTKIEETRQIKLQQQQQHQQQE